jgi:hypothetical protein
MSHARVIAAFLIAPLMTPLVFLAADLSHGMLLNLAELPAYFFVVGGFAYGATALFGIPAFLLFRAKRWNNVLLYGLVGSLIGLLVSVIMNYPVYFSGLSFEYRGWHGVAGALSALMFRMLSGLRFDRASRVPVHGET